MRQISKQLESEDELRRRSTLSRSGKTKRDLEELDSPLRRGATGDATVTFIRKFTNERGRKNLAATGQPRPKYRTALVDSETLLRCQKCCRDTRTATREKDFPRDFQGPPLRLKQSLRFKAI